MVRKRLVLTDLISFNIAFFFAYWLRTKSGVFSLDRVPIGEYTNIIVLSNIALLFVFLANGLYRGRKFFNPDEFTAILKSLVVVFVIIGAATFLFKSSVYSRIILSFTIILSIMFITISRIFLRKIFSGRRENVVIICKDKAGEQIAKKINEHTSLKYYFLGFANSLKELSDFKYVDVVFITKKVAEEKLMDYSDKYPRIQFKIIPSLLHLITDQLDFDELVGMPLIEIKRKFAAKGYGEIKRCIDVVASFFLIILLSPVWVIIIIAIKTTSRGPFLIKQERLGKDKIPFLFYKFRTMRRSDTSGKENDKQKNEVEYLFKKKRDPRTTGVGKILRRICLDEFPQLLNVIKGEMSLVGPRPHFAEELKGLKGWRQKRFEVLPGMTGLWQVSGRHDLSVEKTTVLDAYYVNHMSFLLDLKIIVNTIPAILFSGGRW